MTGASPTYDLGVVGGGVAVQMALPALAEYGRVAIHYLKDTPHGYPQFEYFDTLNPLLDPGNVAAIFVATPISSHIDLISAAIEAGIPTLVEKPLALSVEDAKRLEAKGATRVAIAFRKRYSDVASAIKAARMADPQSLSELDITWLAPHPGPGHWKASGRGAGGGVALDLASHVLDLVEHCLARIVQLKVRSHRLNKLTGSDEYLDLEMRLADNSRVSARMGWAEGDPIQCLSLLHGANRLFWLKDGRSADSVLYHTVDNRALRVESRRLDEYRRMLADFKVFVEVGAPLAVAQWEAGIRNLDLISQIFDQIDNSDARGAR
jgi:predicted dehydrogenase